MDPDLAFVIIRLYYSSMHLLYGFNEELRYYYESAKQDFFLDSPPKIDPIKNCWTHAKKLDPPKSISDPCKPRKNYDPRKMMTYVKNILTHVTHTTQVKV